MRKLIAKFLADQSGATAIEYSIIAIGVSIVIVASVNSMGTAPSGVFTKASTSLK